MPVTTKTKWSQLKVGLLAIGALTILGFLVFLMASVKPLFRSHAQLYTYFNDSASVANGAPVTLNGITVGKISKVELSGESRPGRIVRVTLEIDDKNLPQIPSDSQASLASANLLGTKFINIKKGKSPQIVMAGAEIASQESTDLDDLFAQGNTTIAAMNTILMRVDNLVGQIEDGKGNLGKLLQDDKLYTNLIDIENQIKQLASELHGTLNSNDNSVGKLLHDNGALYDGFQDTVAHLQSIVKDVDDGKGTVGKLFKSDQLSDDAHLFMVDARQTLTDARKVLAGIDTSRGDLSASVQIAIGKIDSLLDKINNGDGAIGQLLNNPAIAEDLDGVMRETQGLLKDFRSNPKKFLHIKVGLF